MYGVCWDMDWASPRVVMSSCPWMYSMKVDPVQRPARWMVRMSWRFMKRAVAPPDLSEWDPTLSSWYPRRCSPVAATPSFTACTMSFPRTCCQGRVGASRKLHRRVSGEALSASMSRARATTARMGQHQLSVWMAWCERMSPRFPFFWLSIERETMSMELLCALRCGGLISSPLAKNLMSCSRNCCVRHLFWPWCVYLLTRSKK